MDDSENDTLDSEIPLKKKKKSRTKLITKNMIGKKVRVVRKKSFLEKELERTKSEVRKLNDTLKSNNENTNSILSEEENPQMENIIKAISNQNKQLRYLLIFSNVLSFMMLMFVLYLVYPILRS